MSDKNKNVVARNRRAFRNYEITDRFEAGIALLGPEVKSLRAGKASIAEAYASFKGGELYLVEAHIPEYSHTGYAPHEPMRPRKLLMHKRELAKLEAALARKGLTLIPIQVYFFKGRAKIELGIGKGRRLHDKRDKLKHEEALREARRHEGKR